VVRCPYCGYESEFKLLKTWRYRAWDVRYYECPRCGGRFRWQVDPTGRYRSYVIRVGISVAKRYEISRDLHSSKRGGPLCQHYPGLGLVGIVGLRY
jgi:DNA-directed RNA polymerase subunit RPC12/RpoP